VKGWKTSICFEAGGLAVFFIGLLYHMFLGTIPFSDPDLTAELIQRYSFHQEVGAKVMVLGGIFIVIGLITMLVTIVRAIIKKKEIVILPLPTLLGKLDSTYGMLLMYFLLVIPFTIPFAFYSVYKSINSNIIVKHFGCGCPNLDGSYGFNANNFNAIVWAFIVYIIIFLWTTLVTQIFKSRANLWLVPTGIIILIFLGVRFYARSMWM
jgi:cation transporter-like permease